MGGGCDTKISGNTAEELVSNGSKHLMESTEAADKSALEMMQGMQNDPVVQKQWMDDFRQKFTELPED
jgi:hypothetical protein